MTKQRDRIVQGLILLLLPVLATAVFWPSLDGAFIMDDWGYITQNPAITKTSSPLIFWTSFQQPDYWPLSYTAFWSLYRLFGEDPLGYHVINVFLHSLNALLVAVLAIELGLPWWSAFLFLVHPLHVQAVSWIIQLKTLLATCLGLLATVLLLKGERRRPTAFLTLGMLAKSSLITLPAAWFVLGKDENQRRIAGKLLLLSLGIGTLSFLVQDQNFTERSASIFQLAWWDKPFLAAQNFVFYLQHFFWPYPLGLTYDLPIPSILSSGAWASLTTALLLFITPLFVGSNLMRRLALSYTLLLLPGLGFVSLAGMKISLVYDHWAYLADVFLVLWVAQALKEFASQRWALWLGTGLTLACIPLTLQHTRTFANEDVFWRQAALTHPTSAVPPYNLGVVLEKSLRLSDAAKEYERAIERDPQHGRAWYNLGRLKELNKDSAGARLCFRRSEELRAQFPQQRIPARSTL